MAQEVTMEKVYHVGMDVHKETVEISIFCVWDAEPYLEKRMEADVAEIVKFLQRLGETGKVKACYEAGCMGFVLYRALEAAGIECVVVAPGKLPRRVTERVKTDRRDARNLAKLYRAGEVTAIRIPTVSEEAARDYIRLREDMKKDIQRTKRRLLNFLLRLGFRYEGGACWTKKHREWIKSIPFADALQKETCEEYYSHLKELEERVVGIDKKIDEIAQSDRFREAVNRLRCFKGIDNLTALACVCEVGDFMRFPSAGSFMSYLGLVPREHSSGDKKRQGGITKAGNGHLRRLLIEASWHYRYPSPVGSRLQARRIGQPAEVIAYANKSMRRLQKKYLKLVIKRGKKSTVAVTAVARELAGFIWGAMNNKMSA